MRFTGHDRAPQRVTPTRYTVSRLPDDTSDHTTWSVQVEAAGFGRWAVRNGGRCLAKDGEWEYEPLPSSRSAEWLDTVRWDDLNEAIRAAQEAEPLIRWNGLTPADVLERQRTMRKRDVEAVGQFGGIVQQDSADG